MRALLDTHIWLWGELDPDRLGPSVRRFLAATAAVYDLVLVTADTRLLASGSMQVLANS